MDLPDPYREWLENTDPFKGFEGTPWWFIVIAVGAFIGSFIYKRRRSSALRNAAQSIGFQFLGNVPSLILKDLDEMWFRRGKIENLLRGNRENIEIEVFGLEEDSGECSITTTIAAISKARLARIPEVPTGLSSRVVLPSPILRALDL